MKFAFVVTINPGYMFSLNSTINSMEFYGTKADFHILYHDALDISYRNKFDNLLPFKVYWYPLNYHKSYPDLYQAYFVSKYKHAAFIMREQGYDAICIIDGDLFMACNVNEYFEKAMEGKLITAAHVHSGLGIEHMHLEDWTRIIDRSQCGMADFPLFVSKQNIQFLDDWHELTFITPVVGECCHPLIACNRSVIKNFKKENIIVLNGDQWVFDRHYWTYPTHYDKDHLENGLIADGLGRIYSVHNRWWFSGRANNEIRPHRNSESIDRAIHNFNTIRDFMAIFNSMHQETYWDHYEKVRFNKDII